MTIDRLTMGSLSLGCCLLLMIAIAGCSGAASEPCDTTDDCFQGEFCDDGICQSNDAPGNGDNNGHSDAGHDDTTDVENDDKKDSADNGADDTGGADGGNGGGGTTDACRFSESGELSCDDELDDLRGFDGIVLTPDEEGCSHFGCSGPPCEEEFMGGQLEPIEAQICPEQEETVMADIRACADHPMAVHIELRPLEESCLIDEWMDVEFSQHSPECDSSEQIQPRCHHVERPAHGGYKWTEVFQADSNQASRLHRSGFHIDTETDAYFPYQIDFSFESLD